VREREREREREEERKVSCKKMLARGRLTMTFRLCTQSLAKRKREEIFLPIL